MVLFITLYKAVLTFQSVDKMLNCDHSNKRLKRYFNTQDKVSGDEIQWCDQKYKLFSCVFHGTFFVQVQTIYCEGISSMYRLFVAGVRVIAIMDPNHIATMAQRAMQHGDFPQALNYLNMGLALLPPSVPQYAARFLSDRAECFWQLGNAQSSATRHEGRHRCWITKLWLTL